MNKNNNFLSIREFIRKVYHKEEIPIETFPLAILWQTSSDDILRTRLFDTFGDEFFRDLNKNLEQFAMSDSVIQVKCLLGKTTCRRPFYVPLSHHDSK